MKNVPEFRIYLKQGTLLIYLEEIVCKSSFRRNSHLGFVYMYITRMYSHYIFGPTIRKTIGHQQDDKSKYDNVEWLKQVAPLSNSVKLFVMDTFA